jgi:lysozyme
MAKVKRKYWVHKWVYWCLGLVLLGIVGIINYQLWLAQEDRFVRYQEFGIEIPVNFSLHGIDVSSYQGRINWPMVKAMDVRGVHIDFAFIKATEGLGRVDAQFRRNWENAKDAGMTRGAYHFFLATKSGRAQAENFLATANMESGDIPPVLDIEETYGVRDSVLRQRVKEWLDVVQTSIGVKPIIYTSVDFYRRHLMGEFDIYPLWVAHYLQENDPKADREWDFWQHSKTGHVSGIGTFVDFSVFKGDSTAFRQTLLP